MNTTLCRRCRLPDVVGPHHLRACPYWKGRRITVPTTIVPADAPVKPARVRPPSFTGADVMRILRDSEDPLTLEQVAQRAGFRHAGVMHQQVVQQMVLGGRIERLKPRVGPALYQVPWEDDE